MKHGDGGKLSERRPGEGYQENYELIWPSKKVPEVPAEEDKGDGDGDD